MGKQRILDILDKYQPSMEDSDLKLNNGKLPSLTLRQREDYTYCVEWGDAKRLQMEINSYDKMREEIEYELKNLSYDTNR